VQRRAVYGIDNNCYLFLFFVLTCEFNLFARGGAEDIMKQNFLFPSLSVLSLIPLVFTTQAQAEEVVELPNNIVTATRTNQSIES
jgi:hypothetical protein